MKIRRMLLLAIFLLSCQTAFSQTVSSSITIKINRGSYVVSGVVTSDSVKNQVAEKVKSELGGNADLSKIRVSPGAKPFKADWLAEFDKSLAKIKTWKSGVVIFSNSESQINNSFPLLPEEIANAKIVLSDGQTISPKDYKNKVVVLFLFASWVTPGIDQAQKLNEFYQTISARNIEMIGMDTDDDPGEKDAFPQVFKKYNLKFKLGWMDSKRFPAFVRISKLDGIPQTFVIFNGRLRGVFTGGGTKTTEKLKETILKILDENNL
jgi:peroxiredoxin